MGNPEKEQDRVQDIFDLFNKEGVCMFHTQRKIYENLRASIHPRDSILEAGCGVATGTAILSTDTFQDRSVIATDKVLANILFAQQIYPHMTFDVWDITEPYKKSKAVDCVICVEAIEHVENVEAAIKNLCDAARKEVWISTPNGNGKPRVPENPYHVREYPVEHMLELLRPYGRITVRDWRTFDPILVGADTTNIDPLVYQIEINPT